MGTTGAMALRAIRVCTLRAALPITVIADVILFFSSISTVITYPLSPIAESAKVCQSVLPLWLPEIYSIAINSVAPHEHRTRL